MLLLDIAQPRPQDISASPVDRRLYRETTTAMMVCRWREICQLSKSDSQQQVNTKLHDSESQGKSYPKLSTQPLAVCVDGVAPGKLCVSIL